VSPTIGFVLITHDKPRQVLRLMAKLNAMFDHPLIVCHHNFSISYFPVDNLSNNIVFVNPHVQTDWGKFSLVEAMLQALQLMHKILPSLDWFILLSGSDYPIKPAAQISNDLASSEYDVHIDHQHIDYFTLVNDWQRRCYHRYCCAKFPLPLLIKTPGRNRRELALKHPLLAAPFVPFSRKFHCFAGGHWFCANRNAAEYLIEFHNAKPALANYYRRLDPYVVFPDESYYHTIFCNAAHLKVSGNCWRFIDWTPQGCHPKVLVFEDLPRMLASSAHFARKFDEDIDANVLDELDAVIE
jgi:Core-2/I-Branching enzyme